MKSAIPSTRELPLFHQPIFSKFRSRLLVGWVFLSCASGLGGEPQQRKFPGVATETLPLEEVETYDGHRFRGEVVGYDVSSRSYILKCPQGRITVPEEKIFTIRHLEKPTETPADQKVPEKLKGIPPSAINNSDKGELPATKVDLLAQLLVAESHLPRPDAEEALKDYQDGIRMAREGLISRAREYFESASRREPACCAPDLFLTGLALREKAYSRAYSSFRKVLGSTLPESFPTALLALGARQLGYSHLEDRFLEEDIRKRFDDAQQMYNLFQFWRERDPVQAQEAWRQYVSTDPDFTLFESPEGKVFRAGKQLLESGEYSEALVRFRDATENNPYMAEVLHPYRILAFDGRISLSRKERDYPLLLGDLEALQLEAPSRGREIQAWRDEGERDMLRARLDGLDGPEQLTETLRELSLWIPDVSSRFAEEIRQWKARLAPREKEPGVRAKLTGYGAGSPLDPAPSRGPAGEPEGKDAGVTEQQEFEPVAIAQVGEEVDKGLSEYFPLKPGSEWVYLHGDGTRDTQRLARRDSIGGSRPVYRFENEFRIGDSKIPYAKSCYFDGTHLLLGSGSDAARQDRILALPLKKGFRWSWRKGDILYEREYEEKDVVVVCRAGMFADCLKVRSTSSYRDETGGSPAVVQWFYYARGTGLVKVESDNPIDGRELMSYSISTEGSDPEQGEKPKND